MGKIDDIIDEIRKKTHIETILKKYGLSRILLREIVLLANKGLTNKEIAQKCGIHASTMKGYSQRFKTITEEERKKLSPLFQIPTEKEE